VLQAYNQPLLVMARLAAAATPAVLQLLDAVHGLLRSGRTATQRDLYYTVST
jgi:DNA topoisomerase VI subunit A